MNQKDKAQKPAARRRFDSEFKASAVRMVENGQRVSDVAQAFGIPANQLHRWRDAARQRHPTNDEAQQLAELSARVRQPETKRDILKKALSIFSRQT